jgi:hypothetical protein
VPIRDKNIAVFFMTENKQKKAKDIPSQTLKASSLTVKFPNNSDILKGKKALKVTSEITTRVLFFQLVCQWIISFLNSYDFHITSSELMRRLI